MFLVALHVLLLLHLVLLLLLCVIDVFNCTHPSDVHALFSPSFVSLSLILIQQNFALDNLHPLLKKPHNREALNIAMELCTMGY